MSGAGGIWAAGLLSFALGVAQARTEHAEHSSAPHAPSLEDHPADPNESARSHVPPEPPSLQMGELSTERMIELMQMEDDGKLGMLMLEELEWRKVDDRDALAWDARAWYGSDYDKLWIASEGTRADDETKARTELSWDRIVSSWWSMQAGVRHDVGEGPSRSWAALGVHGLAPYFFEVAAAVYLGEQGRTALRFEGECDLLLTQRLVLRPRAELELFGKADRANGIGSGLSEAGIGLRLRYEIRRELAPYVGVHWLRKFGRTADFARAAGRESSEAVFVAGFRAWF